MADQEGNVFLTLLKDKVLWLLLRPVRSWALTGS